MEDDREQEWSDPRSSEGGRDLMGEGGGDDPDDVDVEENLREAREGEDDAPPL